MQVTVSRGNIKRTTGTINLIKKIIICGIVFATIVFVGKSGILSDGPIEYTIPEGAISGGIFEKDGVSYERFQLNDKFYILNLSNGATIPQ